MLASDKVPLLSPVPLGGNPLFQFELATADTDAPSSVREAFVNQATAEGIGQGLTDSLLTAMGGQGKYAIVSCGQTAENLNSWIEVQKSYTASKYPNAQIVDIVYAGLDPRIRLEANESAA